MGVSNGVDPSADGTTHGAAGEGTAKEECLISASTLLYLLRGVQVALKASDEHVKPVVVWLSSLDKVDHHEDAPDSAQLTSTTQSLRAWSLSIWNGLDTAPERATKLINVALAVAYLRELSRRQQTASSWDLKTVWALISDALIRLDASQHLVPISRSAQGFLTIPLCSLTKDGCIDELFRFHVWLPDGGRGNPELAIHSHQPFAQSWVLAGEAIDHAYNVQPAISSDATHCEYALKWGDGKDLSTVYKTHQTSSTIENTRRLCKVTLLKSSRHTLDMSYMIPSKVFHATEVPRRLLHATLFYFDSSRGFHKEARVLGPPRGDSFTQLRAVPDVAAEDLARTVDRVRELEFDIAQAQDHTRKSELEQALRCLSDAESQLNGSHFTNVETGRYYRCVLSWERGAINRRFGRYERAKADLEEALQLTDSDWAIVSITGELGVVQRHMNQLEEARTAFQRQYDTARELKREGATCRAIGNLGMVNFRMYRESKDPSLLDIAIDQLKERIKLAKALEASPRNTSSTANEVVKWYQYPRQLTIGLSRISLCYSEKMEHDAAISAAHEGLELARSSPDATITAMSLFFYGRSLLKAGLKDDAVRQFNEPGASSPAIALCKEPSTEHHEYLQDLVDAGADLQGIDGYGYGPLDYAVFNGDTVAEAIVIKGIQQQVMGDVDGQIELLREDARLRKGYRELLQEHMRPRLKDEASYHSSERRVDEIRAVYATSLTDDEEKRCRFDELKYVKYTNFSAHGRLPRSTDGLTETFSKRWGDSRPFIIFFSYARVDHQPESSPDDEDNTQYRRMIHGVERVLLEHPDIKTTDVGIWVDYACVDQNDPRKGVAALPMIIAQCDVMISLIDDTYYDRAWCSVEVMMMQTLVSSYYIHLWYEQVLSNGELLELRKGPLDLDIDMEGKKLTFEEDRPKLSFLARQCQLLGGTASDEACRRSLGIRKPPR